MQNLELSVSTFTHLESEHPQSHKDLHKVTAASTEEFFFEAIWKAKLPHATRPRLAILISILTFVPYHVPCHQVDTHDIGGAVTMEIVDTLTYSANLGIAYWRTNGNLVASIICHAIMNNVGGLTLIHISCRGSNRIDQNAVKWFRNKISSCRNSYRS